MNYRILIKKSGSVVIRAGKKGKGRTLHKVNWSGNKGAEAALDLCRDWASLHLKDDVEYEETSEGKFKPKKEKSRCL